MHQWHLASSISAVFACCGFLPLWHVGGLFFLSASLACTETCFLQDLFCWFQVSRPLTCRGEEQYEAVGMSASCLLPSFLPFCFLQPFILRAWPCIYSLYINSKSIKSVFLQRKRLEVAISQDVFSTREADDTFLGIKNRPAHPSLALSSPAS